jgi:hypothetical protein
MRTPTVAFAALALLGCALDPASPSTPEAVLDARSPAAILAEEALLLAKARSFRSAILDRHLSLEGLLLYRVDLERIREQLAEGRYEDYADTPTFTGLFTATSCARADVEPSAERAEALADAQRAFDGLELLMRVTGRRGLLARGVRRGAPPEETAPHERWFAGGPGYEGYSWRGDVSMDQYANGLLPALEACRTHFPDRTRSLVTDVAGMLLETEMKLVDPDGRRTRYGDLSSRAFLGFNSIAKLTGYAVFALAADLDADPRWAARRDALRDEDHVVASSTITNVRIFGITNFSNDHMAWNLYRVLVPLARRTSDPALPDLLRGVRRTWKRVRPDRNAYFALVFCGLMPEECEPGVLRDARETLLRFPEEKRKLAPSAELAQLPRALLPDRKLRRRARQVVPIELRPASSLEWKSSPYRVNSRAMQNVEYTGLDYLAAYWLYRGLRREDGSPPSSCVDP